MQKRLALSVPHFGFNLPEHVGIAREAEDLGYTDAWSFEVDGQDCFAPLALFALHSKMRIGTAIANVYTRGPATLAQSAASIADLAPGRFEFGIGHFVFKKPWPELLADYNIAKGRIWILVLVATATAPWITAKLRGLLS